MRGQGRGRRLNGGRLLRAVAKHRGEKSLARLLRGRLSGRFHELLRGSRVRQLLWLRDNFCVRFGQLDLLPCRLRCLQLLRTCRQLGCCDNWLRADRQRRRRNRVRRFDTGCGGADFGLARICRCDSKLIGACGGRSSNYDLCRSLAGRYCRRNFWRHAACAVHGERWCILVGSTWNFA